ncbi:unannotated protein [freshwater metagenome]|uniref:Unannotated protein n=1 Tax=freshwater metagenome TaxID=449393 RepID=A0A6J7Q7X2_9ZZZZ
MDHPDALFGVRVAPAAEHHRAERNGPHVHTTSSEQAIFHGRSLAHPADASAADDRGGEPEIVTPADTL